MFTENKIKQPTKSAKKPQIQVRQITVFNIVLILDIFNTFKVNTMIRASNKRLAGIINSQVVGNIHNSHMGKIILYNFKLKTSCTIIEVNYFLIGNHELLDYILRDNQ